MNQKLLMQRGHLKNHMYYYIATNAIKSPLTLFEIPEGLVRDEHDYGRRSLPGRVASWPPPEGASTGYDMYRWDEPAESEIGKKGILQGLV
jgi:hypothetical protein